MCYDDLMHRTPYVDVDVLYRKGIEKKSVDVLYIFLPVHVQYMLMTIMLLHVQYKLIDSECMFSWYIFSLQIAST